MLKNENKSKKQSNRKKFNNAPTLQNLKAVEDQFNRFAPALVTAFRSVQKEWSPGVHLKIRTIRNQKITAYGTLHTNKAQFIENYRSYDRAFENSTLICQFQNNKITMWSWGEPEKEYSIELWGNGFLLNGVETEYKISNHGNLTDVDIFRNASLLSQCSAKNAHLGGKAKAAKQSGYQQVKMLFQHKNGEEPAGETKSVVDAYRIVAPFMKSRKGDKPIQIRQFRKKLNEIGYQEDLYNGLEVDCGPYIVYLSFEGRMTLCLNKYIYKDSCVNDLNLNETVFIKEAGHSTRRDSKLSKDKTKKDEPIGETMKAQLEWVRENINNARLYDDKTKQWMKQCHDWNYNTDMCYTLEEWLEAA